MAPAGSRPRVSPPVRQPRWALACSQSQPGCLRDMAAHPDYLSVQHKTHCHIFPRLSCPREETCGVKGQDEHTEPQALGEGLAQRGRGEATLFPMASLVIKTHGMYIMACVCKNRLKHLWTKQLLLNIFIKVEKMHLWTGMQFPIKCLNCRLSPQSRAWQGHSRSPSDHCTSFILFFCQPCGSHTSVF